MSVYDRIEALRRGLLPAADIDALTDAVLLRWRPDAIVAHRRVGVTYVWTATAAGHTYRAASTVSRLAQADLLSKIYTEHLPASQHFRRSA